MKTTLNDNVMLYEFIDFWLENYAKPTVSNNTWKVYNLSARHIKKYTHNIPIKKFNEFCAVDIFNKMYRDDYARSTINKAKILLNTVFELAVRNRLIDFNPIYKVKIPMAKQSVVVALTKSEQKAVENACYNDQYGDMILFLLFTGLRASELMNLKWSDLENNYLNTPYIYVRKSKTTAGIRIVPLISDAYKIITRQKNISDYVFTQRNGKQVTYTVLKKTYLRIRRTSNVENLTNHVCRHTFATRLAEENINLKALAKLLGHTDEKFTIQRYTHVDTSYLCEQISLLANAEQKLRNNT